MSAKTYHMCMSVRGVLLWPKSEQRRGLKYITKDDGTPFRTTDELRNALLDELAKGHEVIPMEICDNFDWKKGCQGHPCAETEAPSSSLASHSPVSPVPPIVDPSLASSSSLASQLVESVQSVDGPSSSLASQSARSAKSAVKD